MNPNTNTTIPEPNRSTFLDGRELECMRVVQDHIHNNLHGFLRPAVSHRLT